jgi:alkanesulfonate monooxygenase SsuD/methylene tetrahydromethanopterin reductase-like flavin-dependent oxidoreductase (luciferase family)
MPIYLGGLAHSVIDRAVRLADGVMPYDFLRPEEKFAKFWQETLEPALRKHGRSLADFRFMLCTSLWATEDPERDWELFYAPALQYQFRKYAEWAGQWGDPGYATVESLRERQNLLVDTPENVATRLLDLRASCPYHEVIFWYRFRGIPHERALEHLELVANRVVPLLARDAPASQGSDPGPAAAQSETTAEGD